MAEYENLNNINYSLEKSVTTVSTKKFSTMYIVQGEPGTIGLLNGVEFKKIFLSQRSSVLPTK